MPSPALNRVLQTVMGARKPLAQTYRAYKTVKAPISTQLVPRLPERVQPVAKGLAGGAGLAWTGSQLYGAYNDAGDQVGNTAQQLAAQAGIQDPKTVQEIGARARSQMIPLAYRAVAPGWLGGDTSPVGQELSKHIRTIAAQNVLPTLWRPSQAQAQASVPERVVGGVLGNPIPAISSLFIDPRPGAKELWRSIAPEARAQAVKDLFYAARQPSEKSPIVNSLRHVFEPAQKYYTDSARQFGSQLGRFMPATGD